MPCELSGDELRKRIAELKGWTDLRHDRSHLVGTHPDKLPPGMRDVPLWTELRQEAMNLFDEMCNDPQTSRLALVFDQGWFETTCWTIGSTTAIEGNGYSSCEAICRLYVAWKEAKE